MNPDAWQMERMRALSDYERERRERQRTASRAAQPRRRDNRKGRRP